MGYNSRPYAVFAPIQLSCGLPDIAKCIRRVSHCTSRVNLESLFQVTLRNKSQPASVQRVRVQWLPISSWLYIEEEL